MSASLRPAPGAPRPYAFPDVVRRVLSNGMTVFVVPLRRLPVATALVLADAGAECDTRDGAGVAALTADAMAEGTRERDGIALADAFERLGGSLDTGVTWTQAEWSTTVLAARLPEALQLLAEVVQAPSFPDGEIVRLREERLSELLQQRTEPRGLADDMFARFTFAGTSRYATAEGGDERTVPGIGRDALVLHHAQYIVPTRSALIVAGDVDPETVVRQADRAFASWAGSGSAPPPIAVTSAQAGRAVHLVAKADAPQSELRVGHRAVPRTDPDFHALSVMNAILWVGCSTRASTSTCARRMPTPMVPSRTSTGAGTPARSRPRPRYAAT
jgi:zinc protease